MKRPPETEPSDKIATVSNIITATNVGVMIDGLLAGIDTKEGLSKVAIAKLGDLVDGGSARLLPKTKVGQWLGDRIGQDRIGTSTFGAKLDPVVDRFSNAAIFFELARKKAAPNAVLGVTTVIEATKAAGSITDYYRHPDTRNDRHPTFEGKIGTGASMVSIGAFALENILNDDHAPVKSALHAIGYTAFAASTALNAQAAATYARRAFGKE